MLQARWERAHQHNEICWEPMKTQNPGWCRAESKISALPRKSYTTRTTFLYCLSVCPSLARARARPLPLSLPFSLSLSLSLSLPLSLVCVCVCVCVCTAPWPRWSCSEETIIYSEQKKILTLIYLALSHHARYTAEAFGGFRGSGHQPHHDMPICRCSMPRL